MNKDNKYIAVISASFSIAFAVCLICTVIAVKERQYKTEENTEYKYIYVDVTKSFTTAKTELDLTPKSTWIVKEYYGQIGIFTEDGTLVRTVEIYTKTLPEADRRLLREGIRITTKEALESLIEDYSS